MYDMFIPNKRFIITLIFFFRYQVHLLSSSFSAYIFFKPRKNIPVLVGITHRKPDYLEKRRRYAHAVTKVATVNIDFCSWAIVA